MRFTGFKIKSIADGESRKQDFLPKHYRQAGVPYAPAAGMPVLEAFQLVNQMNIDGGSPNSIFYLDKETARL